MNEDLKEWAERNKNIYWISGFPWKLESKILSPLAFPHIKISVDRKELKKAIEQSGALIGRWYSNWGKEKSDWWWICCKDKELSVDNIKSKRGRRGIKKGLKYITVSKVAPAEFAEISYEIYIKSLLQYGHNKKDLPTAEEYLAEILSKGKYNMCEYWGAFYDRTLAAYSTCIRYNNAVSLGVTKSDPEYHKYNPNSVLFFEITKHYLQKEKVDYVTNGVRTLLHPTTINDFLMRMNYEAIYCDLHIELSLRAKIVYYSRIVNWGKKLLLPQLIPNKWKMIEGFETLIKCASQ